MQALVDRLVRKVQKCSNLFERESLQIKECKYLLMREAQPAQRDQGLMSGFSGDQIVLRRCRWSHQFFLHNFT